jgi:AcrR family transcriptional regulator
VSVKGGYWHFKSKDALILAFFSGQEAILSSVLNRADNLAARLRQFVELARTELEAATISKSCL